MEAPENIETPESSTKHSSQNKFNALSRSAPLSLSNPRLTPCRRIGLKRKSTPGTAFRSPLKDEPRIGSNEVKSSGLNSEYCLSNRSHTFMNNKDCAKMALTKEVSETVNAPPLIESAVSYRRVSKRMMISSSKTSTPTTPSVSKSLKSNSCSLRKVLKLAEDESTSSLNINNEQEEGGCLSASELAQVLNKDHSYFTKIHQDLSLMEERESDFESTLKHETLMRMKKIFDQIVELKASLQNAKQHDISNLELLTEKWRDGCQKALLLWMDKLQQQGLKCDMTQLLQESGIPSKIVRYDEETQDFIT